jgi:hypothetical protein
VIGKEEERRTLSKILAAQMMGHIFGPLAVAARTQKSKSFALVWDERVNFWLQHDGAAIVKLFDSCMECFFIAAERERGTNTRE